MHAEIHQMRADAVKRGADEDFADYLRAEILDRIDSGRSFDCDAYRCLYELSRKIARQAAA